MWKRTGVGCDFGPFLFRTLNLNNKKKEKVIRNRKM